MYSTDTVLQQHSVRVLVIRIVLDYREVLLAGRLQRHARVMVRHRQHALEQRPIVQYSSVEYSVINKY